MKQSIYSNGDNSRDFFTKIALHSGTVLLAYIISWMIFLPIQQKIFPTLNGLVALVYLPFGIKIISAFFEGWRSMLYLAPGVVIANALFIQMPFTNWSTYLTLLFSYGMAPTVFKLLDWFKADGAHTLTASQAWRTLVLGGAISSMTISFLVHALWHDAIAQNIIFHSMFEFIVGDMLGLAVVLTVLMAVFRAKRRTHIVRRGEKADLARRINQPW